MTRPNILILMVDQLNGTLFPDGPADWLHAPNLKRLAARSGAVMHELVEIARLPFVDLVADQPRHVQAVLAGRLAGQRSKRRVQLWAVDRRL